MSVEQLVPKALKLENGALRRSKFALFLIGVALAMIGLSALTVEFYRTFTGIQPEIRWNYIRLSTLPLIAGSVLIYTLNPLKVIDTAFRMIEEATPVLRSRIPNGDRRTDPPATNEDEAEFGRVVKQTLRRTGQRREG